MTARIVRERAENMKIKRYSPILRLSNCMMGVLQMRIANLLSAFFWLGSCQLRTFALAESSLLICWLIGYMCFSLTTSLGGSPLSLRQGIVMTARYSRHWWLMAMKQIESSFGSFSSRELSLFSNSKYSLKREFGWNSMGQKYIWTRQVVLAFKELQQQEQSDPIVTICFCESISRPEVWHCLPKKLLVHSQNQEVRLRARQLPPFWQGQSSVSEAKAHRMNTVTIKMILSMKQFLCIIYPSSASLSHYYSMKSQPWKPVLACLMVAAAAALAVESTPNIANTYVTEIICPFNLPMDDFQKTATNQLSRNDFKTNNFTSHGVKVSKLVYKTTYNGSGRIVQPATNSSRHSVSADSVDILVSYEAVLHPNLPTRITYNGNTTLRLLLNYTKGLDVNNGTTEIEGLKTWIDNSTIKMSFSGSPSAQDRKLLEQVNIGAASDKNLTILYLLQQQQFSSQLILTYFDENLVTQQLSPTFGPTYLYQFGSISANFDMATARVEDAEQGIAHSMRGTIKGFNAPQQQIGDPEFSLRGKCSEPDSWHTLFTVGFIRNIIDYSVKQNKDWRGFRVDRSRFKLDSFGWRLVDLEYLVEELPVQLRGFYLKDMRIVCDPLQFDKVEIDEMSDKLSVKMRWSCKGNLLGVSPSPIVLDFDAQLLYLVGFSVGNNMLNAMIEQTFLKSLDFRETAGGIVNDLKLAKYHAKQVIETIRGYTVGTNFRVKDGSSKVALKDNQGIWVG